MKKKNLNCMLGLILGAHVPVSAYATDLAMAKSLRPESPSTMVTVPTDPNQVEKRFHDPRFACDIARLYATGQGVEQNDALAYRLYQYAAKNGVAEAQYALGLIYADERGPFNINDGEERAIYWLSKAADQGYPNAKFAYEYLLNNTHYAGC
jgi:TPR repeat protein